MPNSSTKRKDNKVKTNRQTDRQTGREGKQAIRQLVRETDK